MRHVISILMENESGALSRVAGLFSARGYNIESMSVAPTDDPTLSRMTLVTWGTDDIVEQIIKQLNKLIDVVKLLDLKEHPHIERELMLVKAQADDDRGPRIKHLADIFGARIIDVTAMAYTIELCGSSNKLNSFLDALKTTPLLEVVRSGSMGIARGDISLKL